MGVYLAIPAGLLAAALQSTLMPYVAIGGVAPNLVLVVLVIWVLLARTQEGLVFALSAGVALDTLSAAPFGTAIVGLTLVALLAGLGAANLFRAAWYLPYVAIIVSTLVYGVYQVTVLQAVGRLAPLGDSVLYVILPELLGNLVLMALGYELARGYGRWRHRGEVA
ncbi:MAG: rod shape-determining protein MreD [Anaerolineales bacterium]